METTASMQDRASVLAAAVRRLADVIESAPTIVSVFEGGLDPLQGFVGYAHEDGKEAALAEFARVARRNGATVTKAGDDKWFEMVADFGALRFKAFTNREEVCERVVTGVETVTKSVPDPAVVAAAPLVEVTETVETVEWVCRPLLAADAGAEVSS